MMQKERVEEILADWAVDAAVTLAQTDGHKASVPGTHGHAKRTAIRRRGAALLRDRVSEKFQPVRTKLRAALVGIRERDYADLTAAHKDDDVRSASSGSTADGTPPSPTALAMEHNNWQNRLTHCVRHKLMLSEKLLPSNDLDRVLRAVVAASHEDTDPGNAKRASVLRAPALSTDEMCVVAPHHTQARANARAALATRLE